jgi:hypothetical protein
MNRLGGNWSPGGCELGVFAVEISRISRGSMFALFAPLYDIYENELWQFGSFNLQYPFVWDCSITVFQLIKSQIMSFEIPKSS